MAAAAYFSPAFEHGFGLFTRARCRRRQILIPPLDIDFRCLRDDADGWNILR